MSNSMRAILLALTVSLLAVLTVSAQSATEQSEDLTAFVAQAWTKFAQTENYHFSYDATNSTTVTPKDSAEINTTTVFHAEGDKANANSHTVISAMPSNSSGTVTQEYDQPLQLERIVKDGVVYVNLKVKDTPYASIFNVEDGWWRYDDLKQKIGSTPTGAALDTFVALPLPSSLPFGGDVISSVKELDGDTIDGKAMRVFDVKLNALQILIKQSPATGTERLTGLFKEADLLAASTLSATSKLWIGANDGQIYRLEGESDTLLPYLSAGHGNEVPYDIHTSANVSFDISRSDAPVEISVPTNLHTP